MHMNCVACNNEHDENFCPNCGEKKGVKRITVVSMIEDALSSVTSMDRGFLFNLKSLVLKPQKITVGYINGKRKGILNPISYLIFSITIYLIIISVFKIPRDLSFINSAPKSSMHEIGNEIGYFIRGHLKFFWILSIFPLGLSLKIIFKKYNYLEHLAISSFIIGQATLAGVISYLLFKMPLIFDPIVYTVICWLIYKIYKGSFIIISYSLFSIYYAINYNHCCNWTN
ncbi:MAG TPA: DUF3667 domain-containing protein [Crocinitomix sp.]|nr:DUF3667 domain-containing protein [Crocinitomix sp.]